MRFMVCRLRCALQVAKDSMNTVFEPFNSPPTDDYVSVSVRVHIHICNLLRELAYSDRFPMMSILDSRTIFFHVPERHTTSFCRDEMQMSLRCTSFVPFTGVPRVHVSHVDKTLPDVRKLQVTCFIANGLKSAHARRSEVASTELAKLQNVLGQQLQVSRRCNADNGLGRALGSRKEHGTGNVVAFEAEADRLPALTLGRVCGSCGAVVAQCAGSCIMASMGRACLPVGCGMLLANCCEWTGSKSTASNVVLLTCFLVDWH